MRIHNSLKGLVAVNWVVGAFVLAGLGCASSPATQLTNPQLEPDHWNGSVMSEQDQRYHPMIGTKGMVVADDPLAAEWGAEVLRRGGNAMDAAVATAFAMAVTRPQHSSLGGGGFMTYCPAPQPATAVVKAGKLDRTRKPSAAANTRMPRPSCYTLDYREESPAAATRDMYIREGKARTDLSQNGALASGVPGVTAGLLTALERFGTLPRQKLLAKPIELARQGYRFTSHQESTAMDRWDAFNKESKKLLGCSAKPGTAAGNEATAPCTPGTVIRQADLARTLEAIAREGTAGFYQGAVAKKIVEGLKASGGIMSLEDLKAYKPHWRAPAVAEYRGMEVISMPPPSAGGVVLLQMLGFMERADKQGLLDEGYGSAKSVHAITSAMSLAFADRAVHFGDPDHVQVPVAGMLSPEYLDARWKLFNASKFVSPAGAGEVPGPDGTHAIKAPILQSESVHTTHFSVVDREGNAVAITTTINDDYGSGFMPPGTGVMMNNEMDDFSIQPGVPNLFGLVGAEANAVAPNKRPLSSMSPTIVRDLKTGQVRLVLGAAGGPTITTSVFLSILNRLRFGMSITDAVHAARVHQQWRPEETRFERQGLSVDTLSRLSALGHKLVSKASIAKVHAIERFANGRTWGVADPRGEGGAAAE